MRIIVRMLTFTLFCLFVLSALAGCTYYMIGDDRSNEDSAESNAEVTVSFNGKLVKSDSEQITAFASYLEQLSFDREVDAVTMESKINLFRSGGSPLHVRLDPNIFYFICGYYDSTHENENGKYCCAPKYTWIEYASEKDILEHYDGKKLVVAFQINKSIEVLDILEGKIPPSFEHYQIYEPIFENGINVSKPAGLIEESFIYLNASDDLDICHSSSAYYHGMMTIPCVEIDGEYYVTMPLDQNGESLDALLSREFGEYAEMFASIIDVEKYSVTDEQGQIHPCGAFKLDGFMKEFSKIVSKDRLLAQLKKDLGDDVEITADLFLNQNIYLLTTTTALKISNNNLYINNAPFDSVEIIRAPILEYNEDKSLILSLLDDSDENLQNLNGIQYAPSCFMLTNSINEKIMLEYIYIINGNYYILSVNQNDDLTIFEYKIGG